MSTSGFVGIALNNTLKGYYNHADSYPESLGVAIIRFLNKANLETFAENLKYVTLVNENDTPTADQIEQCQNFADAAISTQNWYGLLRNLQFDGYLYAIEQGHVKHMLDGTLFPTNSMYCEYAYVIDLDRRVFEYYKGFQKAPKEDNRFGCEKIDGFYPVKLILTWSLDDLSSADANTFF